MAERTFDFTSLDTFQTCRKKYYYRMVKNLVPNTVAPALEFGKAIHLALEAYYKNGCNLEMALDAFTHNYADREGDDRRTIENGIKVLRGYAEVYKNEPFKVIDTEVGFAVPISNMVTEEDNVTRCNTCGMAVDGTEQKECPGCLTPYSIILCGRLDALVDWDGQLYVLEHKTSSSLGMNYFKQFEINMQVDGYVYAATELTGRQCLGAVINVLEVWKDVKKPTAKTKTLEEHYARDPQGRSVYELDEYKKDVPRIVRDLLEAERTGNFYRNKRSCFSYNYKCPYWDICKYGENDKLIARDFKEEKWEPYKQVEEES